MLSKKELLLKSIKELLALNVSDDEILLNLKEVGIERQRAKQLVAEARGQKKASREKPDEKPAEEPKEKKATAKKLKGKEKEKRIEQERKSATEELAAEAVEQEVSAEEIAEGIAGGPTQKQPKQTVETKPIEAAAEHKLVEDIKVSKLWEKGILGTINQRLAEMKELKEDLDKVLDKKTAAASKRELEKIKVLFDSQRTLLVSKVDSEIEAKAKAFADMIELKLRDMRNINKQTANQIEKLHQAEEKDKAEKESLSRKLLEVNQIKEDLVASLNSEIIKSKTQGKQLLEQMNQKLKEMDDRINKTLQLENQIVEGLIKQAEQSISQMVESKAASLENKSKQQLQELHEMKENLNLQQNQRLAKIESKIDTSLLALDNQTKERLAKLDELRKALTIEFKPQRLKAEVRELQEFKTQFVEAIKENTEMFNIGIRKLNQQSQTIEKQFALRAEKIDKKIQELDNFEKNFAKELGVSLQKLTKKQS